MDQSEDSWARREAARRRQIMIGKARPEYQRYLAEVPVSQHGPGRPTTPDPADRSSKRCFDRALSEWRCKLHLLDAEMGEAPEVSGAIAGAAFAAVSVQAEQDTPQASSTSRSSHRRREQHRRNRAQKRSSLVAVSQKEHPQQPPVAAQSKIRLQLADQLPWPPAMSATTVSNGDVLIDVLKGNTATLPEPLLLALLGPRYCPDTAAATAAAAAAAAVRACCAPGWLSWPTSEPIGQTQPASSPVTPCRPQNSMDFDDNDETPPPIERRSEAQHVRTMGRMFAETAEQHAQTIMKPLKVEIGKGPGENVDQFKFGVCVPIGEKEDNAASYRHASPPPSKGVFQERWCDIKSPITPRQQRTEMRLGPPTSVTSIVKTPGLPTSVTSVVKTPGLLFPETPSPRQLYNIDGGMFPLPPFFCNYTGN